LDWFEPTAAQSVVDGHDTPKRLAEEPTGSVYVHADPPLVVATERGVSTPVLLFQSQPTATQSKADGHETLLKAPEAPPTGEIDQVDPLSVVVAMTPPLFPFSPTATQSEVDVHEMPLKE
jgi:hypothetical protein